MLYLHIKNGSEVGTSDNTIVRDIKTVRGIKKRISNMIPRWKNSIVEVYSYTNLYDTNTYKLFTIYYPC